MESTTLFDGKTFDPKLDGPRLNAQLSRVHTLMSDGNWRTLQQISDATGDPQASVSARCRDLRKRRFGGHNVQRRRRGEASAGVFEYRLLENA